VSLALIELIVRRFDSAARQLEREAIRRIVQSLNRSEVRFLVELERLSARARSAGVESAQVREAMVRSLLDQVRASRDALQLDRAETLAALSALDAEATALGRAQASALVQAASGVPRSVIAPMLNVGQIVASARVEARLTSIGDARVANGLARLLQHTEETARIIEGIIIDGAVAGTGWGKMSREVRKATGLTHYSAERIVRTESMEAIDTARNEQYEEDNVDFVIVLATADDRVCGYCAWRSGKVYRREDIQLPFHPNCRCTTAAVRKEFVESGADDISWLDEHHAETVKRAEEKPLQGVAPSEVWRGRTAPPKPVDVAKWRK